MIFLFGASFHVSQPSQSNQHKVTGTQVWFDGDQLQAIQAAQDIDCIGTLGSERGALIFSLQRTRVCLMFFNPSLSSLVILTACGAISLKPEHKSKNCMPYWSWWRTASQVVIEKYKILSPFMMWEMLGCIKRGTENCVSRHLKGRIPLTGKIIHPFCPVKSTVCSHYRTNIIVMFCVSGSNRTSKLPTNKLNLSQLAVCIVYSTIGPLAFFNSATLFVLMKGFPNWLKLPKMKGSPLKETMHPLKNLSLTVAEQPPRKILFLRLETWQFCDCLHGNGERVSLG